MFVFIEKTFVVVQVLSERLSTKRPGVYTQSIRPGVQAAVSSLWYCSQSGPDQAGGLHSGWSHAPQNHIHGGG